MSNFFDEIAAKLSTLSGSATPKQSLEELNEFDVRDIQAVRVSEGGGGGGSQPFKDLGTVTALELIENGPKTLYTPTEGEFVCIFFSAGVSLDVCKIGFEPYMTFLEAQEIYFQTAGGSPNAQDLLFWSGHNDTFAGLFFPTSPVKAVLITDAGIVLLSPAGTWQANHAYALDDAVVDSNGNIQIVTAAGTSGGTEPVWQSPFDPTTDGGVTWTCNGAAPTTGSVSVVALAGVPA